MSKEFVVIVPAYNEEKTIEKVVADVLKNTSVDKCLVVDNNSSDDTRSIVEKLVNLEDRVQLLYEGKQGKGNALRAALDAIDFNQVEYVGIIDADDTYPAVEFDSMLNNLVHQKLDMIVGNRFNLGGYQKSNDRPGHIIGNKIISKIIRFNSGVEIDDALSGMRVFNARYMKSFKNISDGFQLETEFSIHCGNSGLRYGEMSINFEERGEDNPSKLNTIRDGIRILKFALKHSALTISTKVGFLIGVLFIAIGLYLSINVINEYLIQNNVSSVATAVAGSLLLMIGTQFLLNSGLDSRLRRIERQLLK